MNSTANSDITVTANPLLLLNGSCAESAIQAPVAVFPVILNFPYKGQQRSEALSFPKPIDIPSRGEIVTFKFNDFGTIRRISGTVEYSIREFYGPNTVSGVDAGFIVQIILTGVTDQPL